MNKKDNVDIEPEDLKKLAVKTDKVSKIVTAVNSSIIALLICFNTYYNVFYYKPTKRKNDKSNLFSGNSIVATDEEVEKIKETIEKQLNIEITDDLLDEYLLLDAVNKNPSFKNCYKYYLHSISQLIKDNPYLNKEEVYNRLLNVEIVYKKRPFYVDKNIAGQYYEEPYNSIGIYKEFPATHETLHEIIHCIYGNDDLPRFFSEGMTELLNKEYCNNENPFDGICSYYFEVAAVKMICEVTSSDTVLKAFTLNNMDYIIEEMTNYGITKEEASKALEIMESILDSWHNKDKEYKYSIGEVNKNCIFKFQKCIDTKNNDNIIKCLSYYYNEMLFFNCMFKDKAEENYCKDLRRYGCGNQVYFSTYLRSCIENNISPYAEYSNETKGNQFFLKK